jgi:hypothetical protein
MRTQRIEIGPDVEEVTIVRTISEPKATAPVEPQPQQRSGGKRGPRKQGENESDADHAARVARYEKKNGKPDATPAASLPTREASNKSKPKGFATTLCKCRGDKQKSKRQGTYGQPDYVAAVYEPITDFSAFGIPSLEIPAGQALCGTFRKRDSKETFDAAVYHTGHGERNGDWMQLLFYDEATGEAKGGNGRPLFKTNDDIVELFLMPCQCEGCKAS